MSNLARRITDLESRVSAIETVVGIDYPGPTGPAETATPRIPAGARVHLAIPVGENSTGIVTDAPPDDGKYLIEFADGEQVWVHENDLRGAESPATPST